MIELGSQTARDELRSRGSTRGQRARVRRRHPNHSLVKIHRSYTVKEVARLLGVHTNTVHQWIKVGLQIIENTYPKLIQGQDLRRFLQVRRDRKKCPCKAGQMYCFRCRASKALAGGMLDYRFRTDSVVNAIGICRDCDCMMYRCVKVTELDQFREKSDTTFPQAPRRLSEIDQPSVNSDLGGDV
jgi:hypothetical protein